MKILGEVVVIPSSFYYSVLVMIVLLYGSIAGYFLLAGIYLLVGIYLLANICLFADNQTDRSSKP